MNKPDTKKPMTEQYKKRLVELGQDLLKAREEHEKIKITDVMLYSKIDYLIGYISALEEPKP